MLEVYDYSSRRGVLVSFLPKMHELLKSNASKDKYSSIKPPSHYITWSHAEKIKLLDINRKFLIANVFQKFAGYLIYRLDASNNSIYIEALHIVYKHTKTVQIIEGLLKKLELDDNAKDAIFFVGDGVKMEENELILSSAMHKHEPKNVVSDSNEWENVGNFAEMANIIKIRYIVK